jgi:hypothetical protein
VEQVAQQQVVSASVGPCPGLDGYLDGGLPEALEGDPLADQGAAFGSQKAVIRATARYGPVRGWM